MPYATPHLREYQDLMNLLREYREKLKALFNVSAAPMPAFRFAIQTIIRIVLILPSDLNPARRLLNACVWVSCSHM